MRTRLYSHQSLGRKSVNIDVDLDEVVAEISDADLISICLARGLPILSKGACEDAVIASRLGDLSRAMSVIVRALPRGLEPFAALLSAIGTGSARPC